MNTQKAATWFGYFTLIIGVLGFVPGVVNNSGLLFGLFNVNVLINLLFIITGLVGIASAATLKGSKSYFKVFGVIYLALAILGFIGHNVVLGLVGVNLADNILYVLMAINGLYFGFRNEAVM